MVHHRILIGIAGSQLRLPRRQAGPQLRADKAAAAVAVRIAQRAGHGRLDSHTQIVLPCAVLHPVRNDVAEPIIAEDGRVDRAPVFLYRVEPDELQIQVVVRGRVVLQVRLYIEFDMVLLALPLKGRAHHAADILAGPAAHHLVLIGSKVHDHGKSLLLFFSVYAGRPGWHSAALHYNVENFYLFPRLLRQAPGGMPAHWRKAV